MSRPRRMSLSLKRNKGKEKDKKDNSYKAMDAGPQWTSKSNNTLNNTYTTNNNSLTTTSNSSESTSDDIKDGLSPSCVKRGPDGGKLWVRLAGYLPKHRKEIVATLWGLSKRRPEEAEDNNLSMGLGPGFAVEHRNLIDIFSFLFAGTLPRRRTTLVSLHKNILVIDYHSEKAVKEGRPVASVHPHGTLNEYLAQPSRPPPNLRSKNSRPPVTRAHCECVIA